MKIDLPIDVNFIIRKLEEAGFEAYAVGGCVRDCILGKEPNDWDITTSAKPEQVKSLFDHTIDTGIQHGTVTVMINHVGYEVTTYRIDGKYEDGRHPTEVTFTPDLLEDLKRRDFTINAMAYNDSTGLVDAFDGVFDLERGIIRCVGKPEKRFSEDALRMLRAIRFAAQLGFSIDENTMNGVKMLAGTLKRVSAERIQVELVKLLLSDNPDRLRDAYTSGLTAVFLPEFDAMMKTKQNTIHHKYSVGEHTIRVIEGVPADKVLRIAALLHDVAKPVTKWTDEEGVDHFTGHPQAGAEMCRQILRRLKFDNDTIKRVSVLVKAHDERPSAKERSVRRAIARIGTDAFPELFDLKRADTLAQSEYMREDKLAAIDDFERLYKAVIEKNQALAVKDLLVTGKDAIELGIEPGPKVGEVLDALLQEVLDEPEKNNKEYLLTRIRELK